MKIKEYRNLFANELSPIYDKEEVDSFFYLILEKLNNLKRVDLALQPELHFTLNDIENWNKILEKLKEEIPIQYCLGSTQFYELEFEVNENVLIPRPETEELVDWILSNLKNNNSSNQVKIVDIGTGSGCIAISLAKNIPNAVVYAIDVSEKAIETAKINAKKNGTTVTFIEEDILTTNDLNKTFDIIVSNPPYVRNLEKAEIKKNVLDQEPHLALFVDDTDALLFYRKIAALAQKNLASNGQLYFEINQYLGIETVTLLEKMNFRNIVLRKDIYGNDRMICCTKS